MARPSVGFSVDTTEAAALAGFLKTISVQVNTERHIGPVLKYTHAVMSDEFTQFMSVRAPAQPERFHHVYEWGQIGDPTAKLWVDNLSGNGNNRLATFTWRASKQMVPVRSDFQEAGVKKIHVFVWKAPVMEYGQNLTIRPKRGSILAYFTGPTNPEGKYKMQFTRKPIQVSNTGGKLTKGAFTREYISWWSGSEGEAVFNTQIRRVLEEDLGRMPIESVTSKFRRARSKTIGMATIAEADAAEAAGAAAATKYLMGRSAKYIEQAKARERIIYG